MKKYILLLFIALFITTFSNAQARDINIHIKTFNDADGTFSEKEDDGSGTIEYFNEMFDELYIFVEIDPQNLGKYLKSNQYNPFTLKLTATKGNVLLKEFKKTFVFSTGGFGYNKCFILFQLNKLGMESYKVKAELIKGNSIISTAKKTVYIDVGE